jgi:endonuclease-3
MALPPGAKARAPEALARMAKEYEAPYCFLRYETPFQLLVAVILSAQCTDAMVNKVTPGLFAAYPTPQALAGAPREDVERLIHRTGFYRNKAKNVQGCARMLVERFGGEVPRSMADLMSLPGVARKTANVVQSEVYGLSEGVCVDTHVGRVARRLGLSRSEDPVKVEADLMKLYPEAAWSDVPYYYIRHGRAVCDAKKPRCGACFLADLCPKRGVTPEQMAQALAAE